MCVIVRSSHRAHFNLRTYFFSLTSSGSEHMLAQSGSGHCFELSAVQCWSCSALFSSYVLLSHSCNGEKKI
jgi:hypothetical protein